MAYFRAFSHFCWSRSALAELRRTTCSLEAVLLTLFHSRVTGQKTGGLECGTIALIEDDEGTGDAVADGAGLAGHAAALDGGFDVDLAHRVSSISRPLTVMTPLPLGMR